MSASSKYILGIDTSCDDTSMAVLCEQTGKVLSNVISSQIDIHKKFGGIVPEVASRAHMENLSLVLNQSLDEAGITVEDLTSVAVTQTPGLIGCLLVGTSFARALSYRLNVPLYRVNHLEAHLFSPFIQAKTQFPCLGLVVSGGHTAFYHIESYDNTKLIGQTVDDAAGEAFDKCAKMLDLGYPGGPVVDRLAKDGNDKAFAFTLAKVKAGPQYLSFSGMKTAAKRHIQKMDLKSKDVINDFCASLQRAIVESLIVKARYFLQQNDYQSLALSGGVAMNSLLRKRCQELSNELGLLAYITKPEFCTDNGAMVAHAAQVKPVLADVFRLDTVATKKIQAKQLKNETLRPSKN